ncbi:MAG: hypothetical protein HYZ29_15870 [Myxococcales bacterium]|nr:hypothetical protein [Myxococcales bacterium]MCC6667687.1 hypothetical protein [Polyangiaceae bacterium]
MAEPSVLKHPRFRRVLLVIAFVLAGLSGLWWFQYRPFVSTDDARVAAPMAAGGRVERVLVREGQAKTTG